MTQIRPVSDLRNRFAAISREVKENREGVILTKNGYPDMVVMSYDAHNQKKFEEEVYLKLMEAELQARATTERLTHEEVFANLRKRLADLQAKSSEEEYEYLEVRANAV